MRKHTAQVPTSIEDMLKSVRCPVSTRDLELARACYAGEITMVDFWFGRLMQRLESLSLLEDTAIIFTSDHGFYFGEHGYFGKLNLDWDTGTWGYSPLYDEITRVPLLILMPGHQPRRVSSLVCQPDLMPTILDLAGAPIPEGLYGQSLVPLLKGSRKRLHNVIISSHPLHALGEVTRAVDGVVRRVRNLSPSTIFDGEWTLVYSSQGGHIELYHTKLDPGQRRNLLRQHRSKATQLHAKYLGELEALGTPERLLESRRSL